MCLRMMSRSVADMPGKRAAEFRSASRGCSKACNRPKDGRPEIGRFSCQSYRKKSCSREPRASERRSIGRARESVQPARKAMRETKSECPYVVFQW